MSKTSPSRALSNELIDEAEMILTYDMVLDSNKTHDEDEENERFVFLSHGDCHPDFVMKI